MYVFVQYCHGAKSCGTVISISLLSFIRKYCNGNNIINCSTLSRWGDFSDSVRREECIGFTIIMKNALYFCFCFVVSLWTIFLQKNLYRSKNCKTTFLFHLRSSRYIEEIILLIFQVVSIINREKRTNIYGVVSFFISYYNLCTRCFLLKIFLRLKIDKMPFC